MDIGANKQLDGGIDVDLNFEVGGGADYRV